MSLTIPYLELSTGVEVQTATANDPKQVEHKGAVLFVARATGTGTWSITYSYTAYTAAGVNDDSEIRTITVSNATASIVTAAHNTAARAFRGWVSAVTGTVLTGALSVEG